MSGTDLDLVGRTGEPFRVVVEAGPVREFARAVRAAKIDDPSVPAVAPPTFLISAIRWQGPEHSAWHGIERSPATLHAGQSFTFTAGPIPVGAVLDGVERIDQVEDKLSSHGARLRFVETTTSFRDEDGTLVAVVRTTSVERLEEAP